MSEADIDLASVLDAMRKSARATASGTKAAMMARDTVALACKKTPIGRRWLAIISIQWHFVIAKRKCGRPHMQRS